MSSNAKDEEPLPDGWKKHFSKTHDRNYYFHSASGKSVWKYENIPQSQPSKKHSRPSDSQVSKEPSKRRATEAPTGSRPFRVAIIVPFRDLHDAQQRKAHLDKFIPYMSDFLSRLHDRVSDFHIFILEQSKDGKRFNRGKLLNIGFKIARDHYDSFIFHDVDLLPKEPLEKWYAKYPKTPMHIARCWDRYNSSKKYFGGIVAFSRKHFEAVDGFPNTYWGWGGEDDELQKRVADCRLQVIAPKENLNAIDDLENMDLDTKLSTLRKTTWKCPNKWEVADEHKGYRQERKHSRDRNYQMPPWWGLRGVRFQEQSREAISGKCTKVTVDLGDNFNDDGTKHWATELAKLPQE